MKEKTKREIKNAINDYLRPMFIGYKKLGSDYEANEIWKAMRQIEKAVEND